MLRSSQTSLKLDYRSDDEQKSHEVSLYDQKALKLYRWYRTNQEEKSYKLLDGNIGYVTLATIRPEDVPEIKKSFANTNGMIIDIRTYPSTFVPFTLGSFFVSKSTPFVKFSMPGSQNPGEFMLTKSLEIPGDKKGYKGK